MSSNVIDKTMAALLRAVVSKDRSRPRHMRTIQYYSEDKVLMATDGIMMVLWEVELPFETQLLDVAKGMFEDYLVPVDNNLQPIPANYKAVIPDYHSRPVAQLKLGGNVRTDRLEITEAMVKHRLYVNYYYLEKLRKYPTIWDLHIPIPSSNMCVPKPIVLKSEGGLLTAVIMVFAPREE